MAIFSAYFDASGNKRATVLTVTGFISRVSKWNRFNAEWANILKRESVSTMHMTDFVSSAGEFAGWKGQTERRREFIRSLSECIKRNTNKGFATSVLISDYDEVNAKYKLAEAAGSPFAMATRACLGGIHKWAMKRDISVENIMVAIEKGDEGQGELIDRARLDGFKVITLNKSDVTAFQAGDIAAWKFRNAINKIAYGPLTSMEDAENIIKSMEPLRGLVKHNGAYDKPGLVKLCMAGKVPRR